MLIWACFQWIALVFLVPETFLPSRLKAKAVMLRKRGRVDVKAPIELDTRSIMRVVLTRVRIPVALLAKEPMALLLCIASAILLGIIYMFFSAFDIICKEIFSGHSRLTCTDSKSQLPRWSLWIHQGASWARVYRTNYWSGHRDAVSPDIPPILHGKLRVSKIQNRPGS